MRYLTGSVQASVAILYPVCRWLANRDLASYEVMATALRPPGLAAGRDNALQASLSVGRDINLFETVSDVRARDRSVSDATWALQEWLLSQRDDWYENPALFRRVVRRALLAKAVDDITQNETPSDVAVGLAWLVAQDPAKPPSQSFGEGPERDLGDQKLNSYVGTDEQWRGLVRWAVALGCAVPSSSSRNRRYIVPDPTAAILEELPAIQDDGLAATQFYEAMRKSLPILDGGTISEYMRSEKADSADPRGDAMIGPAFSLALKRLSKRGVIHLLSEADATYRVSCMLHGQRWTFDRVAHLSGGADG